MASSLEHIQKFGSTLHTSKSVDSRTATALSSFAKSLANTHVLKSIVGLILYGSRARGDHNSPPLFTRGGKMVESDVDVAVVMRGNRPSGTDAAQIEMELFDSTVEALNASGGLILEPVAVWESDLENPLETSHPDLYQSIIRDGIEWQETA
ncbi:MAG: nucleotidyltransferase domain-containing protein [Gammaproteobacteria bacterium]|nr:nucleotidyltransferase domain-containing protein [Gammaproteobacteria bacterium]